jgi:hypothetical protein
MTILRTIQTVIILLNHLQLLRIRPVSINITPPYRKGLSAVHYTFADTHTFLTLVLLSIIDTSF